MDWEKGTKMVKYLKICMIVPQKRYIWYYFFSTNPYTKLYGFHWTTPQETKSITVASVKGLEGLQKM